MYPLNAGGHESYCRLLEEKGDLNKAFDECYRAVGTDNKNSANWLTMASVQEKLGKLTMAEISYANALEIEPNNEAALLFLGRLNQKTGKFDDALENLQKLLDLKPSYSDEIKKRIKEIKKQRGDEKTQTSKTKSKAAGRP